jgi:hypothetical protein
VQVSQLYILKKKKAGSIARRKLVQLLGVSLHHTGNEAFASKGRYK